MNFLIGEGDWESLPAVGRNQVDLCEIFFRVGVFAVIVGVLSFSFRRTAF